MDAFGPFVRILTVTTKIEGWNIQPPDLPQWDIINLFHIWEIFCQSFDGKI